MGLTTLLTLAGGLLRRLRAGVRRHGVPLLAIVLGTCAHAVVMTDGTFSRLDQPQRLGAFYDELGRSLLEGRCDVPPEAIGSEAILIDGRAYGYFGPTPALLRLPLNALWPERFGRWTCWMLVGYCALSLGALYRITLLVGRLVLSRWPDAHHEQYLTALFLLQAALGTTLFFIGRRASLFHEALSAGVAFALCACAALLGYLTLGGLGRLALAAVAAFLSYLARGSVGVGLLLALAVLLACQLALLARQRATVTGRPLAGALAALERLAVLCAVPRPAALGRHAAVLAALLVCGTALGVVRNLLTLGNAGGVPPIERHIQVLNNPRRLERTGGSFVQPTNLPSTLFNYLRPDGVRARDVFPWFLPLEPREWRKLPGIRIDGIERFVSLTAAHTFWTLLAGVGVLQVFRRRWAPLRLPLLGAALACGGALSVAYFTQRYLHDAFPLLTIAATVAWQTFLAGDPQGRWRRTAVALLVLLGLFTCLTSIAVTMAHPRWS